MFEEYELVMARTIAFSGALVSMRNGAQYQFVCGPSADHLATHLPVEIENTRS